jgi:hypothetical protein
MPAKLNSLTAKGGPTPASTPNPGSLAPSRLGRADLNQRVFRLRDNFRVPDQSLPIRTTHFSNDLLARELRPLIVRNLSRDPESRAEAITAQVDGLTPNLRLDWCRTAPRAEVMVWQRVYTRDGPVEDSVESANADDRGIFRFADLAPGPIT